MKPLDNGMSDEQLREAGQRAATAPDESERRLWAELLVRVAITYRDGMRRERERHPGGLDDQLALALRAALGGRGGGQA